MLFSLEINKKIFLREKCQWKAALECTMSTADKFVGNNSLISLAIDSNVVEEMAINTCGSRFKTLNLDPLNHLVHIDSIKEKKFSENGKEGNAVWTC